MSKFQQQGELFSNKEIKLKSISKNRELIISKKLLEEWQEKLSIHQASLLSETKTFNSQGCLFENPSQKNINDLNPLNLAPLPLSFWRWPDCPHKGPAIYLVMDKIDRFNSYILLYIGETGAANQRWKGDHDCKSYLSSYNEALVAAGMTSQLSIRFWSDVPASIRSRRKLEQDLIRLWLPPFNKETRSIWSTPFTSEIF